MNRTALLLVLLTGVTGCVSEGGPADPAPWAAGANRMGGCAQNVPPPSVPGTVAWNGAPAPMAAPYTSEAPPRDAAAAQAQMWNSVPLDMVAQARFAPPSPLNNSGIQLAGGQVPAPGNGGNPQAIPYMPAGGGCYPPGVVAGVGMNVPGSASPFRTGRTSVRFSGPSGMKVTWFSPGPDGKNANTAPPINVPGRYNFLQSAVYRLKLMDIPGRQGLELYPTLDVVPTNARTNDFLSHSAVPLIFTDDDFDQVVSGNYVVKVIYLPDPQNQDLANPGIAGEVVSTRLEPGIDPIAQAQARGSILLVIRMGNIDLEAPNTPAMDAPNPFAPKQPPPPPPGSPQSMGPMMPMMPNAMMGGPMMGGPMMGGPMMGGGMPMGPAGPPSGPPPVPASAGSGSGPASMLPPVPSTTGTASSRLPDVRAGQGSGGTTQPVMFQVPPGGAATPSSGAGFFPLSSMK